jgi:hypothetical protein
MNNNQKSNNTPIEKKLFLLENIAKFCDKCGTKYTTDDINVMFENQMSSIVAFSCTKCKASHVANFTLPMGIASRVPVNSDLAMDELQAFSNMGKVTVDEVLNLYELLSAAKQGNPSKKKANS